MAGKHAAVTPALTIHLDINGTCTPVDNTDTGIPPDALVNMYLSKSCFGNVIGNYNQDNWSWTPATWPDIVDREWMGQKQLQGKIVMSHYDYLRATEQDKAMSHLFLQSTLFPDAGTFEQLSVLHARLLEFYKPTSDMLFASVVKVFRRFPCAKFMFRTFGVDAPEIVSALNERHGLERMFVGYRLIAMDDDRFTLKPVTPGTTSFVGTRQEIGNHLESLGTDVYIIDDYQYWNAHARSSKYGKPIFPVSDLRQGRQVRQIAFDDNDCMDTGTDPYITFVRTNPCAPMLDDDFFIRHITKALDECATPTPPSFQAHFDGFALAAEPLDTPSPPPLGANIDGLLTSAQSRQSKLLVTALRWCVRERALSNDDDNEYDMLVQVIRALPLQPQLLVDCRTCLSLAQRSVVVHATHLYLQQLSIEVYDKDEAEALREEIGAEDAETRLMLQNVITHLTPSIEELTYVEQGPV